MPRLVSHRDVHPHRARIGFFVLVVALAALAGLIWGKRVAADQIVHVIHVWTGAEEE